MGAKMSKKRKGRGDTDEAKSQTEQAEQAGNAEGAVEETRSQDAGEAGGPDETAGSEATDDATGGAVALEADGGSRRAAQTAAGSPSEDADPEAGAEGEAASPEVDPEARSTQTKPAGDVAERAAAAETAAAKELGAMPGNESDERAGAARRFARGVGSRPSRSRAPGGPPATRGSHRSGRAGEGCRPNPGEAAAAAAAKSPESRGGDAGHGAATRAPGKEGAATAAGSPPGVETRPQHAGLAVSPGSGKPPQIAPSSSSGSDAGTFAVKLESNAERVEKEVEEVWVRRDAVEATHAADKPKRNSHHDGGDSTAPEPDPILPVATEVIRMAMEPTPPQGVTESQGRGLEDKRATAVASTAEAAKTPTAIVAPSTKRHSEADSVRGSEVASVPELGETATSPRADDCAQTAAAQLATRGNVDEVAAKPGPRGPTPLATDGVAVSPGTPHGDGALAVLDEGVPASPGQQQPPSPAAPRGNDHDHGGSGQAPAAAAVADSSADAARTNGALDKGVCDDDAGSAGAADPVSGGASASGGAAAAAAAGSGGGGTNGHHRCDDVNGYGTASANDDGDDDGWWRRRRRSAW
ncbi:collagen alpha-1(I) chain-like [Lethenteron reissneri]|uniref:collagen alpha-1(I) chain-like n=1 Tax=Lethenteron reissneri TaxID=7753 RepID=UPI002AB77788|nr:collagen alpha-1(I) chain-like [Lethenteron reissneri]XP_061421750.1 collagen alpha-1(I) chain-like [Lethenteron reissneri]